ncbi:hypothetical protein tb265_34100 [Gemmatimonadetes bacterium T265]|nr:hypothetical protein tb265_34100 [Gemmatimonadetes bacterium T265]
MAGVGEQREGVGEPAAHGLGDEQRSGEDERDFQRARRGALTVAVGVAVRVTVVVAVRVIVRVIVPVRVLRGRPQLGAAGVDALGRG